jgi:hypothetical protein
MWRLMAYPILDLVGQAEDLIRDDRIVLERPITGPRGLVTITSNQSIYVGWFDGTTHTLRAKMAYALRGIALTAGNTHSVTLDCELLPSGELHFLDVLRVTSGATELITPADAYRVRRGWLDTAVQGITEDTPVRVRTQARTRRAKTVLLETLRSEGCDRVLARHLDHPYQPGRPAASVATLRFVRTAHLVVMATVRSGFEDGYAGASLGAFTDGHDLREVARVTYPTSEPIMATDVAEVSYLHWTGRTLYRPQFESIVLGADRTACTIGQFPDYTRETFTFPIHYGE